MSGYRLLMLSGDSAILDQPQGAFASMMSRFRQYWERIDILVPSKASYVADHPIFDNVFVHPSPYPRGLQALYIARKAHELLREHRHDLIVSHDFGLFYNGLGALLLNRPYVSEIHHVEGYPRAISIRERVYRAAAHVYVSVASKRVLAFRTVNRVEVPELLQRWGVPKEKILCLPSSYLDLERFRPLPARPRRWDVLYVGRFASNKGIMNLLDMLEQVRQTHPSIRALLIGRGNMEDEIRRRIAKSGLPATVLTDYIATEELVRHYNESAMLVCASSAEGGPRVTLEAMACGTPVISTRVGVMRDMITDGENGLLFDGSAAELAQAVRRLLDDEAFKQRLAEAGRQSVLHLKAETVIQTYAQGYHDLIEGKRNR